MSDDQHEDRPGLSRRSFLGASLPVLAAAGLGTFSIGCGGAALPSRTVVAGPIDSITPGEPQRLEAYDVFLIRTDEGIAAISGRCPHRGCGLTPATSGFVCNCHGSTFTADGTVTRGPAAADLTWLEVRIEDGQVVVDPAHQVEKGTFTPVAG